MQLENPKLASVIASLSDEVRAEAARKLARLNRALASQNKADTDLIDSLRRVLESRNPQAQRLRELIKEISNG
jgi:hypothetical protein